MESERETGQAQQQQQQQHQEGATATSTTRATTTPAAVSSTVPPADLAVASTSSEENLRSDSGSEKNNVLSEQTTSGSKKKDDATMNAEDVTDEGKIIVYTTSERYNKHFKVNAREIIFKIKTPGENVNPVVWVESALRELVIYLKRDSNENCCIGLTLNSNDFSQGGRGYTIGL